MMEMELSRASTVVAVAIIVVTLVATGPAAGLVDLPVTEESTELGDGTATIGSADFADGSPRIEPGRFASGIHYLRTPSLRVDVADVTGTPRLVYVVSVPAFDFERVATRLLNGDESSTVVVPMSDQAFDAAVTEHGPYHGVITVRVQSFSGDRVVVSRNVTIEVSADG